MAVPGSRRPCVIFACLLLLCGSATAQVTATKPADEMIQLNLPQTVELKLLIEYVSKRLDINIVYDEPIGLTKVALSGPMKIRKDQLLSLLQSVLKMSNLELIDTAQGGWKTIGRDVTVNFVALQNISATEASKKLISIINEREKINGGAGKLSRFVTGRPAGPEVSSGEVTLVPDSNTNQLVLIATQSASANAMTLIKALDVPSNLETKVYRLQHVGPGRVDGLMKNLSAANQAAMSYTSATDEPLGLLVATGSPAAHKQLAALVAELDVASDAGAANVQFYKLMNSTAADVLKTIRSLQGERTSTPEPKNGLRSLPNAPGLPDLSGPNALSSPGLAELPLPPAYREYGEPIASVPLGGPTSQPSEGAVPSAAAALAQSAVVTADTNTNTIIVVAPPDVQRVYKQLITRLDKRRPQVLVEVTLVVMDTSDTCQTGVELGNIKIGTDTARLVFSSFGLSVVDPKTGKITLNPSTGLNAAYIDPDEISVIVQALATSGRSKVLAAPKILMNDNATGMLTSIAEQPFTSVNASNTVSTTSFAGYASAGTTVTLTPHISERDYLQMKYAVVLNSFTDKSPDPNVPPPRQTDSVSSEVTVPNGAAVVVGGLTRKDSSDSNSRVPLAGDIPILQYLFGSFKKSHSKETLFVFIRPIILKDDQFEDLKYLSETDLKKAEQPSNYPASEPILLRSCGSP